MRRQGQLIREPANYGVLNSDETLLSLRQRVAVMEFQGFEGRAKFSTLWCLFIEIAARTRGLLSNGAGCIK